MYTDVFYSPSTNSCIDLVDNEGRSQIKGETLEQIRKRYPDAQRISFDKFMEQKDAADKARFDVVKEIDEDQYDYWLGVLPPCHWRNDGELESFQLSEKTTGNWTTTIIRLYGRYFETTMLMGASLQDIKNKLNRFFPEFSL